MLTQETREHEGEGAAHSAGAANRLRQRLAAHALEFGRSRPLPDDVNLIAVSRNGAEAVPCGA